MNMMPFVWRFHQNYSVSAEASESNIMADLASSSFFLTAFDKKNAPRRLSVASLDPLYLKRTGDTQACISTTAGGKGVLDTAAVVEVVAFDENFSVLLAYFKFGALSPVLLPILASLLVIAGAVLLPLVSMWGGGLLVLLGTGIWAFWRLKLREVRRILTRLKTALGIEEPWRKVGGRGAEPMLAS